MELKLIDVQRAQPALQKVVNADLPISVAFRFGRMAKAIDDVFLDIEKQRVKLVEKHGEETADGMIVKKENIQKFQSEFSNFLSTETVELDITKVPLSLLENVKLTPLDALALAQFIEESE